MDKAILKDLNSLIQLDIDAIYCYDEAIKHIDDRDIATTLEGYRSDHQQHVDALSSIVSRNGGTPAERSPDLKGRLLQGMTALRSVTGTEGALKAMEMNEKKTNEEYDKAQSWAVPSDVHAVLEKNLDDERRHLAYVQSELHVLA
jgi:uncharacterized protein (TIGR02284 family)